MPIAPRRKTRLHAAMFSNFVVRGMYEPGSTQKMITFAAALEEAEVQVGTVIPEVADEYEVLEGACVRTTMSSGASATSRSTRPRT